MKVIEAGVINSTAAERMNVLENEKNMLNDAIIEEQKSVSFNIVSSPEIFKWIYRRRRKP
ncbi:MAG: hypothetical protein ACI4A5_01735 [Hominilimicola sp.]